MGIEQGLVLLELKCDHSGFHQVYGLAADSRGKVLQEFKSFLRIGQAGAQGGGFMGGGAGAGAGSGKDGKKARRRKYTPFRVEDEDELPEGYVNPMSQTYGMDEDIAPAPRRDDGWDLRQW